ncbi:MAG TPA: ATP-binding cassette domain-containing protein [Chitinophagaceae bacterium]|nr:ATP-binding cassette domain-containing protein [Chitinophagaceae bacterium]
MTISLSDAGKRFNRDWIFRHFTYTFETGQTYAITGPNGSGKSTLLQVLSGSMHFNEGKCDWHTPGPNGVTSLLPPEQVYGHVSICAPYLEVVEEMTLREFLQFHQEFKPFLPGVDIDGIITAVGLEKAADKQIRHFSSGMKQRVKLAQCIFSNTALLLLDEPCTNLDAPGIDLYLRLISLHGKDRLIIVSSNDEVEYSFCRQRISMTEYK